MTSNNPTGVPVLEAPAPVSVPLAVAAPSACPYMYPVISTLPKNSRII
jgi:hypothetical protein